MKKLLYACAALAASIQASGQITITTYKSIAPFTIDSCGVPTTASLSSLSSLGTATTNATWDLSTITLQSAPVTYAYQAKTSGYSTATYSDSTTNRLGTSALTTYKAWRDIKQSSANEAILGEEIITRQAKSLGSLTGNNIDSIVFPTQVMSYNTAQIRKLKFPATMGSVWIDSVAKAVSFNLTVTSTGTSNAPCIHRQKRVSIDSVVGWGQMRVPILGKTKTVWMDVLQVHHLDIAIDSFFMNGMPAPAAALTLMGASQGQSSTKARTFFYRASATRPLIELVHAGAQHTGLPSVFYIHESDLEEAPLGVASGLATASALSVYPNPVRTGVLSVELPESTSAGLTYTIINTIGQQIAQGALQVASQQRTGTITLPQQLQTGTYYVRLTSADGQAFTSAFNVVK